MAKVFFFHKYQKLKIIILTHRNKQIETHTYKETPEVLVQVTLSEYFQGDLPVC